jgi:hypothetical protein
MLLQTFNLHVQYCSLPQLLFGCNVSFLLKKNLTKISLINLEEKKNEGKISILIS